MIKTHYGNTEMNGSTPELLAYFSCITETLYNKCLVGADGMSEEEAKETIRNAVEMGFEPEKVECELSNRLDKLIDVLEKLCGMEGEE